MIFFTRELYLGYQPTSGRVHAARREWYRNSEINRAYLHIIKPLFPRSILKVARGELHDAVITGAVQSECAIAFQLASWQVNGGCMTKCTCHRVLASISKSC